MKITTIGIDLAKEVFQIHGVDDHGKTVLRKQLRQNKMTNIFLKFRALFDWHGNMRQFSPLGEKAQRIWTYCQAHVTSVCQTLREDQQA